MSTDDEINSPRHFIEVPENPDCPLHPFRVLINCGSRPRYFLRGEDGDISEVPGGMRKAIATVRSPAKKHPIPVVLSKVSKPAIKTRTEPRYATTLCGTMASNF